MIRDARMMHDRYPFLGACNADLWDHNYTRADGHNVGVWEWDENIGNFGLTVSHYEVYVEEKAMWGREKNTRERRAYLVFVCRLPCVVLCYVHVCC